MYCFGCFENLCQNFGMLYTFNVTLMVFISLQKYLFALMCAHLGDLWREMYV